MIHDFLVVWEHADSLLDGLANTIMLTIVGASLALLLGAMVAVLLMSSNAVVRLASRGLVDLMRCVPFLMLAYLVYPRPAAARLAPRQLDGGPVLDRHLQHRLHGGGDRPQHLDPPRSRGLSRPRPPAASTAIGSTGA